LEEVIYQVSPPKILAATNFLFAKSYPLSSIISSILPPTPETYLPVICPKKHLSSQKSKTCLMRV